MIRKVGIMVQGRKNLERDIVKRLHKMILQKKKEENKPYWLKLCDKHVNLAGKNFQRIWSKWWKGGTPPKLEVDFIFVFEDVSKLLDEALIVATEVEYFRGGRKNFFEGIQQVIGFSIFGFDGLSLWHLFPEETSDTVVDNYAGAVEEIIRGFKLPIFYLAAKITDEFKLKCFSPWRSLEEQDVEYFVNCLHRIDPKERNPLLGLDPEQKPHALLNVEEIRKRRNVLKVIFQLPI
jgi:hypothetical protein